MNSSSKFGLAMFEVFIYHTWTVSYEVNSIVQDEYKTQLIGFLGHPRFLVIMQKLA